MLSPFNEMILSVASCQLFSGVFELFECHCHVTILVTDLQEFQHGVLRMEDSRLPGCQLSEVQKAVAVLVQLLEVLYFLLCELFLCTTHLCEFPKFFGSQSAIAILVFHLQRGHYRNLQNFGVHLRKEKSTNFRSGQRAVTIDVCCVKLGSLSDLPLLQFLHLFIITTVCLVGEIAEVLIQRELAIFVGVNLLDDALGVLLGNCRTHGTGKGHDLLQGHLSILVLVKLFKEATKLLW
mmetsp:Transcript_59875/g.106474  ORF Transcript_59875/g.106474 Transcript_59875/m.106474 type:complete len:237 (+) Transcript_59875:183-893(+)